MMLDLEQLTQTVNNYFIQAQYKKEEPRETQNMVGNG